jgi:ABC-type glycerol-3-phosphate transport system substrate-binding protein
MRRLSILVLAIALVAAGCGGGNDESAATTETTTTEETTSDTTTSDETTTDGSTDTTDLSGILGDDDCLALASVGATMAQAFAGASGSTNDNSAELEDLASKVPDEIKADVQVLAQAFATYSAKLKDIGVEAGKTPTADQLQQLQAAIASLDQQELTAASQRIEAWSKKNCSG